MTVWNYRILRQPNGTLAIHEVYYDNKGNPKLWTSEPVDVGGETLDDLRAELKYMQFALKRPILTVDATGERLVAEQ